MHYIKSSISIAELVCFTLKLNNSFTPMLIFVLIQSIIRVVMVMIITTLISTTIRYNQ